MMLWLAVATHLLALGAGLVLLHRFGGLFQTGHCPLWSGLDIVEATYFTVCFSSMIAPVVIYDLLLTALQKSDITDSTQAYMAVSGLLFGLFHLIGYKTMEQVEHDGIRWRIL